MRISSNIAIFLRDQIKKCSPQSEVYLFGSRTDDAKKGGDIDILVIAPEKLKLREKIDVKVKFYQQFGDQKIDIVSFTRDDHSAFKNLALKHAIPL